MGIVKQIVDMEWDLFTNLNNTGGRAFCQDNKEEFYINRTTQWENLTEEIQDSYLNDMLIAEEQGRNMLFEKYAYMMKTTHPDEYESIKKYLPREDSMKTRVIERIENIVMKWEIEFKEKYPKFAKLCRPTENNIEDELTSARVYLVGEHMTYSYTTNLYYFEYVKSLEYNLVEKIFTDIVKKKGYESIEQVENSLEN